MSKIIIEKENKEFDYTGVVGKALFEHRTGIKNPCAAYDPFGGCRVMECLYCSNCYYKITMENGEAISNTNFDLNKLDKGFLDDDHEILFYDYVPNIDDLFNYLFDEKSQFKFLRTSDNVVMVDYVKNKQKIR